MLMSKGCPAFFSSCLPLYCFCIQLLLSAILQWSRGCKQTHPKSGSQYKELLMKDTKGVVVVVILPPTGSSPKHDCTLSVCTTEPSWYGHSCKHITYNTFYPCLLPPSSPSNSQTTRLFTANEWNGWPVLLLPWALLFCFMVFPIS